MTTRGMVRRAAEIAGHGFQLRHALDADARCTISSLSRLTGLSGVGVNLIRVAPGRVAFHFHSHHGEEEWVYIPPGQAEVALDAERYRLTAAGFVAFPDLGQRVTWTKRGLDAGPLDSFRELELPKEAEHSETGA